MCEFVNFSIAKKLKEKGFDKYCSRAYSEIGCFNDTDTYKSSEEFYCYAPTISQVLKWLRDTHKLYASPCVIADYQDDWQYINTIYWSFIVVNIESGDSIYREYDRCDDKRFDSYELAAIAGIKYCLDNLI